MPISQEAANAAMQSVLAGKRYFSCVDSAIDMYEQGSHDTPKNAEMLKESLERWKSLGDLAIRLHAEDA